MFFVCVNLMGFNHRVDIDRGSMYWVEKASCAKLYDFRKIGVVLKYS